MKTFWSRRSVLGVFSLTGLCGLLGVRPPPIFAGAGGASKPPPKLADWETPYPAKWYLVTASAGFQCRMTISDLGRLIFQLNPMPGMPGELLGVMRGVAQGQIVSSQVISDWLFYLQLDTPQNDGRRSAKDEVTMTFGVPHWTGVASDCRMGKERDERACIIALAFLRGLAEVFGDATPVSIVWRGNAEPNHAISASELATAIREGHKLRLS